MVTGPQGGQQTPPAPQHLPAGPLTPDPAQPGVRPSEGGNRGVGGALQRPPITQLQGKAWSSTQSHSAHLHGACCVPVLPLVEAPPSSLGQHRRGLRVYPVSGLTSPPPGRPHEELEGESCPLTFQTGQLQPHVGTSAAWGERRGLFVSATRGQVPTRPDGCTTGSSGGEKPRPRSRRLPATSGLNLLRDERVLVEKTFRHLKGEHAGGRPGAAA